jgi:hypothetical protein
MTGTPLSDEPRASEPRVSINGAAEQLSRLFGSYKAEWLSEQLFDLFTEPAYWPALTTERPCVLQGGRGTGKTTVLRGLSYEGQYALRGRGPSAFDAMDFVGFYSRVDTNRVRAFAGPELDESEWVRIFAHYLNLNMVHQVLGFADWYIRHAGGEPLLDSETCRELTEALNLEPAGDQASLRKRVQAGLRRLEAQVNNVGEGMPSGLSMQKAPIDLLFERLAPALPGRRFFFLFDEYENFDEYQQRIVNTLVKHSGGTYTFKIGVRELGFRTRATLNPDEQLVSPSDFVRVSISEKLHGEEFKKFAATICNSRLAKLGSPDQRLRPSIEDVLPGLSEDEEASLLGVEDVLQAELQRVKTALPAATLEAFRHTAPLDQLLVLRWSTHHGLNVADEVERFVSGDSRWRDRTNNYRYSLLFTIRRGRGRRGIQKYYAGWDTFVSLAAGNIRYVLELVEQTLLAHMQAGNVLGDPVSAATQTHSAQAVGRKNLTELEGISVHGARLTRLALGLGRVFEVLAAEPLGHAPEIAEFELSRPGAPVADPEGEAVEDLLRSAVMHLALLRRPGNKVSTEATDTRDFDYRLHPIFSAFFVFSHRHKRKMTLSDEDLLGLVQAPRKTIPVILERHNRDVDTELPDQLRLFETYFRGDS